MMIGNVGWQHGGESFRYALSYSTYDIASKNRAREIQDLLLNGEQSDMLIDELASVRG